MRKKTIIGAVVACGLALGSVMLLPAQSRAATQDFDTFLRGVRAEAARAGISQGTLDQALTGLQALPRVIELDRKQPESTMTFARYRERVVSADRIRQGRALVKQHEQALIRAERRYGVPREYIVALWGIETNFGGNTGGYDVINALATLAWDGRRAEFFRKELMDALKIIDQGHITHANMKGSWAGAMGQNQFMPSSFHRFAVDGNADGRKNIWTDLDDVFASTANYLATVGWVSGQSWGREIRIPRNLQAAVNAEQGTRLNTRAQRTLEEWRALGVTRPDGQPIPVVAGMKARIVQPDAEGTPAYLVYDNYNAFMHWNRSVYFATSVGLLAEEIAKGYR